MLKKIALIAGTLLALAAAGAGAYWHFVMHPWMVVESTRYGKIQGLGTAVIRFNEGERKMPKSLEQMVLRGYLPERTELCWDPLAHDSLEAKPVHYKDCEFRVEFGTASATISVPPEVARGFRHFEVPKSRLSWTVSNGLKVYQ